MKKFLQILKWLVISGAALLLLLTVGLGLYAHTEHFRRLVQDQLIGALNKSMRGSVSVGRIEGTFWGDIVLHNVGVRYGDKKILSVPRLRIAYSLLPLLRGRLRLSRVEAQEPMLYLARDLQGNWNIIEAFSSDNEEPAQVAVTVSALSLQRATVDVLLAGPEPKSYRLIGIALRGRLSLERGGLRVDVRQVSSRLTGLELPELSLEGAFAYQDAISPASLSVTNFSIASSASRIKLDGRITDFDKPHVQIKATLEKLGAPDIARFVSGWPLKDDLNGALDLIGPLDRLATTGQISLPGGQLRGQLNLNVIEEFPQFRGRIEVVKANLRRLFDRTQLAGIVSGNIEVEGKGAALGGVQGRASLNVRAAEAEGWTLGDASVNIRLQKKLVSLNGRLKGQLGGAEWSGQVTVADIPRYEMTFAVRALDIKRVSTADRSLEGKLNLKGSVKGAGLSLPDMIGQTEIEILPSSIGPVEVQGGALSASLSNGRIRVARGALRMPDAALLVKGDIGTNLEQRGSLDYEIRMQNLKPWLSMVGRNGAGALELRGSVQGNLASFSTRGTIKATDARLAKFSVKDGRIDFNLMTENKGRWPTGTIRGALVDLTSGIQFRKVDAAVELAPELARVDVKARDQWSHSHALAGDIRWQGDQVVASLSNLSLQLPDGVWKIARPATIKKIGEEIDIDKLALQNGARSFAIAGRLATSGRQALDLNLTNLPLGDLSGLLPRQPTMTGVMAAQAQVRGTAQSPEISASFKLSDATIAGRAYGGILADAVYKERTAGLKLVIHQDTDHFLTANATLPMALSWHNGWRSELKDGVDVRAQSTGLSLAFLNAFAGKAVEDLAGEVSFDLLARGPVKEPLFTGSWQLRGGRVKVIPLGVNIGDIAAAGIVESRKIDIQTMSARALDGQLNGKGSLTLDHYRLSNINLSFLFNNWPALQTLRYQAQFQGNVTLQGSWQAPRVMGKLELVAANLHPNLEFLEKSATPPERDKTIVIVKGKDLVSPESKNAGEKNQYEEIALWQNTILDIQLRVPGDVWVRNPSGVAELRGDFHILKKAKADLGITGTAEIFRGWVGFQGRRFDIGGGRILFSGGSKINPALDIVARHRLPRYLVEAVVSGTAEAPDLTLRSEPPLDQSDILALILFGKPTKDLNSGEQASLKDSAENLAAGYFAGEIVRSISSALGLGNLGFDLGEVNFNGGTVGFGHYFGQDTYVEMSQELDGEKGRKARLEYQLAPDWAVGTSTDTKGSSGVEIIWSKQY